jgi:tRNA modification GTPase
MNGKLSVHEAEALADLIHAETEQQRKLALSSMEKSSEELYAKWRGELVSLLANAEAMIDFAEDELPKNLAHENSRRRKKLLADMRAHIANAGAAKRIRRGIDVAICGRTNAGKSSLFNKLVGESKALVSNISGTTRDVLEAALDIQGTRVNLLDTAGIDAKLKDKLSALGMKKARSAAASADMRIFMITNLRELSELTAGENDIILFNKIDRARPKKLPPNIIPLSVKTGENYKKFLSELGKRVKKLSALPRDTATARSRHIAAIETAVRELDLAAKARETSIEAEHIRLAANAIGSITGEIYLDELLDSIFGNFCLGK